MNEKMAVKPEINKPSELYLFNIANVLAILGTIAYVTLVVFEFKSQVVSVRLYETSVFIVLLMEALPSIIVSGLILYVLRVKNHESPKIVRKLLGYDLTFRTVTSFLSWAYFYYHEVEDPSPFFYWFFSWIHYAVWVQYFTTSKKVLVTYGANSPQTQPH